MGRGATNNKDRAAAGGRQDRSDAHASGDAHASVDMDAPLASGGSGSGATPTPTPTPAAPTPKPPPPPPAPPKRRNPDINDLIASLQQARIKAEGEFQVLHEEHEVREREL